MTGGEIGLFVFGTSPIEHMAPMRTRALLAEAALQKTGLLFFDAAGCDLERGTVQGTRWNGSGWEVVERPPPGLVMSLTNPVTARHREVDAWLRSETRVLDNRGPDKLEQVELLKRSSLARYAIPTERLDAETLAFDLSDWLTRHGAAVVKPVDGERGRNVYFVQPADELWTLEKHGEGQQGTLVEITKALTAAIAGRMRYRQFLIQRYISSTHNGHPLGLRFDVHKKPDGGWGFTRSAARLNLIGGLATNMADGAGQAVAETFLTRREHRGAEEIVAEATEVACQAADLIDRQPTSSIIELGVDFALDSADRLWVIELNVQPEANWAEQDRAMHIIAYARSLLG